MLDLYSPLEQYKILYLWKFKILNIDLSFTFLLCLFLIFIFITLIHLYFLGSLNITFISDFFLTNFIFNSIRQISIRSLPLKGQKFIPLLIITYIFILFFNLIGLIPYSYTLMSQVYITSLFSLTYCISFLYNGIKTYEWFFFSLFLPKGLPFFLTFFIVPLEIISYMFRPLSLALRLFANMISGHIILKLNLIILFQLILIGSFFSSFLFVFIWIFIIFKFCLALIQTYIFILLIISYLKEIFEII